MARRRWQGAKRTPPRVGHWSHMKARARPYLTSDSPQGTPPASLSGIVAHPVWSRRTFLGAALAAGGLSACGGDSGWLVAPSGQGRPGLDTALAQLPDRVQALMRESGVPGVAVAVVVDGRTVFSEGYGVCVLGQPDTVDADTVFQLASVSKSVGATVVAHQVSRGQVGWDTRMQTLLPDFALRDPQASAALTVGDLYAHRSGLPDHAGDLLEDLGYDQAALFARLRYLPLAPFREHYAYTNAGLTAAAEGVAAQAGRTWAVLSREALYAPLGMTRTTSSHAESLQWRNRSLGHVRTQDGQWQVSELQRDPDVQSAAGGVSSSVNDMARWLQLILAQGRIPGGQLIAADALAPALSPQIQTDPQDPNSHYGFGFNVGPTSAGHRMVSHSGAFTLGASTSFFAVPALDIGIVVLTNGVPTGLAEAVGREFLDLVESGRLQRDWWALYSAAMVSLIAPEGSLIGASPPQPGVPPQPLAAYVGTYDNDYYGPLHVELADTATALVMRLGPKPQRLALTHWDASTFVFAPAGESASPGSISRADFDAGGVTLEFFDAEGLGRFVRRAGTSAPP